MPSDVRFELSKEQATFLHSKYPDVILIQKILATSDGLTFTASEDDFIDFYDWLTDESVSTMTKDYEATDDTLMIESIIDDICES